MSHKLYDAPIQGIEMVDPIEPPAVTDVLLGYEVLEIETDNTCHFFTKPKPSKMSTGGWILFGVLSVLCWPLSCFACCIKSSYDTVQRPVYGKRKQDW